MQIRGQSVKYTCTVVGRPCTLWESHRQRSRLGSAPWKSYVKELVRVVYFDVLQLACVAFVRIRYLVMRVVLIDTARLAQGSRLKAQAQVLQEGLRQAHVLEPCP